MGSALLFKSLTGFVVTLLTCNVIRITQCSLVRNTRSEHSSRYNDFIRERRIDGKLSEIQNDIKKLEDKFKTISSKFDTFDSFRNLVMERIGNLEKYTKTLDNYMKSLITKKEIVQTHSDDFRQQLFSNTPATTTQHVSTTALAKTRIKIPSKTQMTMSKVSECEKKSCKWGDYEEFQDWGYYSISNGNCRECQDRCNKDKTCGAIECGKGYCSWWKTGTCTRSVASSGSIFTCWKDVTDNNLQLLLTDVEIVPRKEPASMKKSLSPETTQIANTTKIKGMHISSVTVPALVLPGENVILDCLYNMADRELFTLKWYHNNHEIYRYMPRSHSEFGFDGNMKRLTIDVKASVRKPYSSIVLRDVSFAAAGNFRCEITAQKPFEKVTKNSSMVVVDTNWSKEEGKYCTGYMRQGTFRSLHSAQMACLKMDKCVKVLDNSCSDSVFHLCLSDSIEKEADSGYPWCMFKKPDWELEADGIVCSGSEIYKGRASTVESCGKMCKGISKWFILAKCPMPVDEGCSCYCETSIDINNLPICDKVSNNNFRLYKLKAPSIDDLTGLWKVDVSGSDGGRWNCVRSPGSELICRSRKHRILKIAFDKDTGKLTLKGTRNRGTYDRESTIIWRSTLSKSFKWIKQDPIDSSDLRLVCEYHLQALCDNLSLRGIDAMSLKPNTHYKVARDMAEIEDRIILTRRIDRTIFQKDRVVYIMEKNLKEQVKEAYWYLNVQEEEAKASL